MKATKHVKPETAARRFSFADQIMFNRVVQRYFKAGATCEQLVRLHNACGRQQFYWVR